MSNRFDDYGGWGGCLVLAFIFLFPIGFCICLHQTAINRVEKIEVKQKEMSAELDRFDTTSVKPSICPECDYSDEEIYDKPVYVCGGRYAECYHTDINCPGLQRCQGRITVKNEIRIISKLEKCKICKRFENRGALN